ncbi:MAG: hypothetical protein AUI04_01050 [Candidatus Rokubacteria bacterium 13_2_20CM_2_64_8]|nr:MAG: hypothetical protein AUI04_01050 [Candidatus Rokubacteria bacterium 13_2_20CM_2_64_8]
MAIAADVRAHGQVLVHREVGKDAATFGTVRDPGLQDGGGLQVLDLAALEDDAAGARPQQA